MVQDAEQPQLREGSVSPQSMKDASVGLSVVLTPVPVVVPVVPVPLASGEPNWPAAAIGAIPSLRNFRSWFFIAMMSCGNWR